MDKGLRLPYQLNLDLPSMRVSILGLVDKGLRHIEFTSMNQSIEVSILGLVDKGLRLGF